MRIRLILVSIHLYLQEALEYLLNIISVLAWLCFNPFIPTRGVGIINRILKRRENGVFQSIYTYKRRWNLRKQYIPFTMKWCFNPFIPTRGVGIQHFRRFHHFFDVVSIHLYLQEALELEGIGLKGKINNKFQSIYTYKRRWNFGVYINSAINNFSFNPFIPTRGIGIKIYES